MGYPGLMPWNKASLLQKTVANCGVIITHSRYADLNTLPLFGAVMELIFMRLNPLYVARVQPNKSLSQDINL